MNSHVANETDGHLSGSFSTGRNTTNAPSATKSKTVKQDAGDNNSQTSWLGYLPMLLRGFGALAVVISLYTFLARGWDESGDMIRFLVFLGHTVALAAIGLVNAKVIKEAKGARLLFMLALLSVPLIFAILGAFIYAGSNGLATSDYPSYVAWNVGSLKTALLLSAGSVLLLVPIVSFGFRVLSRNISSKATLLFFMSNLLLLVPFRQPELVALIALISAGSLLFFYRVFASKESQKSRLLLKTLEGKVAFILQFLPLTILVVRSFWLYKFDSILLSSSSLVLFMVIRHLSASLDVKSLLRIASELFSIVLAAVCGIAMIDSISSAFSLEIVVALGSLMTAGMVYELSMRSVRRAEVYRILAVMVLVGGMLMSFTLFANLLSAFMLLVIGAVMMIASYMFQQKSLFVGAIILLVTGLQHQIGYLISGFDFNYWIALAVLGISLIVSGSYLEANANNIKGWMSTNRSKLGEWQY
ncbi:MAG: hypothetical protein KUG78_20010 [Kangiellaceae bacterium]|nr:hypothetical protein [Kangiellaceae bacterium]